MKAATFVDALIYLCRRPIDPAQDVILHYHRPVSTVEELQRNFAHVTLVAQDAVPRQDTSRVLTLPPAIVTGSQSAVATVPRASTPTPVSPHQGKHLFTAGI